jgi:SAM-dependent methyltransferase
MSPAHPIPLDGLAPLLADLELDPASVRLLDPAPPPAGGRRRPDPEPGHLLVGPVGTGLDVHAAVEAYRRRWDALLPADGWLLVYLRGERPDAELARWRNALWPWVHVVGLYALGAASTERRTLQGSTRLDDRPLLPPGVLLAARRREHVLSPSVTVAKFDANAAGWSGDPGKPGYAHHRWMRRYVGHFARPCPGQRLLDFGCGGGWVGIEAALTAPGCALRAFDPSPEMVRFAADNARASGVDDFEARAGFGEAPPYPGPGEQRFDLVYSSGVISFSPDSERWVEGLLSTVRPDGTLVVGDIHRESCGMQRRRRTRPLLPAREMNALTGDELGALLVARGCRLEARAGYQLSWPVPQLMHWSETRARGLLSPLLLAGNRAAAGRLAPGRFDSWVLRLRAPA